MKQGEGPPGRTLRSNDTPGMPLARGLANQNSMVPRGQLEKFLTRQALWNHTAQPQPIHRMDSQQKAEAGEWQ